MQEDYSSIEYSNLSNRQIKRIRFEASQARLASIREARVIDALKEEQNAYRAISERIKATYEGEGMIKGYVCKQVERFNFNPDTYEPRLADFAGRLATREEVAAIIQRKRLEQAAKDVAKARDKRLKLESKWR